MRAHPWLLAALALVAFAGNSLLCRAALAAGAIDPLSFTAVRLASGAVALLALARGMARGPWRRPLMLFAYAIAFSLAYVRIGAGIGALALFAAVQITMWGGGWLAGHRPRAAESQGLALSIAGLLALTLPGATAPDLIGVALMSAAGVAWGVYSLAGRGSKKPLAETAFAFALAAPLGIACALPGPLHWTPRGLALAATSGALTSGVGYAIWYAALPSLTPAQAGLVQLSVPVLAAAAALPLLGEAPTMRLAIAAVLVLSGIALALIRRN